MEKEKTKIQVIDVHSNQSLFECAIEDQQKAYAFAADMEDVGLDVKVLIPTLAETLSESLGYSQDTLNQYVESMNQELEEHEGSCCFDESALKH